MSDEEKRKYEAKMLEEGTFQGYKLRRYWVSEASSFIMSSLMPMVQHIANGVQDEVEHYNSVFGLAFSETTLSYLGSCYS